MARKEKPQPEIQIIVVNPQARLTDAVLHWVYDMAEEARKKEEFNLVVPDHQGRPVPPLDPKTGL